jgi:hypothetical protein
VPARSGTPRHPLIRDTVNASGISDQG